MAVEERSPKNPKYESETLTFKEDDTRNMRYPHNDPLVLTIQIANARVKRCLVDMGSSVDIIYKSSLEKMNHTLKDLTPCSQVIYGFTRECLAPAGTIRLPVMVGDAPRHETIMIEFLVVD